MTDETNHDSDPGGDDGAAIKPAGEFRPYLDPGRDGVQSSSIPRYSLHETIAEGGMGVIVRAFDHSLRRTVAMKLAKADATAQRVEAQRPIDAQSRFLAEARVTGQLQHPGIVPVHELGSHGDEGAYFTMPLVEGQSLSDVFRKVMDAANGWNRSRAVGVMIKVCQTVAYAHSKGVIHRDLKPANVMVGKFGEVYVLDWGLATVEGKLESRDLRLQVVQAPVPEDSAAAGDKIDSGSSLVTMDGTVLGTPAYMPPEQAEGKIDEVDRTSDVYSLGAMLYHLLAGQAPYTPPSARISPQTILARVLEGPPRALAELEPNTPPELIAICEKAMARDKAGRYSRSFDLAEDLQAYLDDRVVQAHRTGAVAELKKWVARHRTLLRSVALVATVLLLAGVAAVWAARHREARGLVASGEQRLASYNQLKSEIPRLDAAWEAATPELKWTPVWRREQELTAHTELQAAYQDLDTRFLDTVRDLENALKVAPPFSVAGRVREDLKGLYEKRYHELLQHKFVSQSPQFYVRRARELGMEIETTGSVRLQSVPAGADVYCFRYEEREAHLLPLPFDPRSRQLAGSPFLRVEIIVDERKHQGIFQAGDRLVSVRNTPIALHGDLARSIAGVGVDAPVEVTVERLGSERRLSWTPFPGYLYADGVPPCEAGSLLHISEQLGLTFEGYPLDFVDRCHAGRTSDGGPLELELPLGSYLLVVRQEGYRGTLFPVTIPWWRESGVDAIPLWKERDIPPGFVYVAGGPFSYGGDPTAFQSMKRGEAELPGFFIGRHEITVAEYLEYLNDPEVGIDELGNARPRVESGRQSLAAGEELICIAPAVSPGVTPTAANRSRENLRLSLENGKWAIPEGNQQLLKPTSPVPYVSQLAASEYAHWRTRRDGGRWRYRLPSDLEWEKAARGVDRRSHVWGDYLVWPFCWSAEGVHGRPHLPPQVGVQPLDESVYRVRDLAGSLEEYSSSWVTERHISRRGGSWRNTDKENFRAANRNGLSPLGRGSDTGFRLVAEAAPAGTKD